MTTRVVAFDAAPRYGERGVPPGHRGEYRYPFTTVHTDEGVDGHTTGYGPHGDGEAAAHALHGAYLPELLGRDPRHTTAIWLDLKRRNRDLYTLTDGLLGMLDVALWDIRAKAAGTSVAGLIGLRRDAVPAYATGRAWRPDEAAVADEARWARDAGYAGYKLQVRDGPTRDVPRLRAARDAVGDDFPLMHDAVAGYAYPDALRVGRVLGTLGYRWFEEPLDDARLTLLRRLSAALAVPVLATETSSLEALGEALRTGACDLVRGDVYIKAGVTGLLRACAAAEVAGVDLEIHAANSALLDLANLHVACAVGTCWAVEVHHPVFRAGLVADPLALGEDGLVHLPDAPGLGVDVDRDWVDDRTVTVLGSP